MSGPPPKLPPLNNENSSVSMLDQIATIANDPSLTNSAYDDSLSMGANQLPPVKKKRRRKKKRPENEPSNAESMVSGMSTTDGSPRVTFENESFTHNETIMPSNDSIINQSIHSDQNINSIDGAPPMTPTTPTQIDLNDHIRQMKIQENKILSEMSSNFVSVTNVSDLLKPDKIRPLNNSAVKPDTGTVFVQQTNGFQAKKRSDLTPSYTFEPKPEKKSEDDGFSSYGLGLVKFIRNITRFSLGIIAAYTGFIAGSIQEQGTIDPNDKVFDIGSIILSILICISGVGTLSFVDPIGRGGLKRLFKLDPSSLINVFTLIAVLLTAIGDVLVEQYKYQINDEDESADLPVLPTGIYVVYWLRFSLLLIAWTVFAFTEPPGGALYARIKEQNRISN